MNKQELRSVLKELTEQKAPAAQIDLWPAIQARVQMSQPAPSRGTIMNTHSNLRLKPAYLLAAVLLIGALLLAFPQGRALAQQLMHFFYRGESNLMAGVTVTPVKWVEQTPGAAAPTTTPPPPQPTPTGLAFEADCGRLNNPHCSVDEIRELVNFPVWALPTLPAGLHFEGASGGPERVYLVYSTSSGDLLIWQEPFTGAEGQLNWEVGADAEIHSVQIGPVTGDYVKGTYNGNSSPPVWDPEADFQQLRWVDQGVVFNLDLIGMEAQLSRDDLAALAATLTDGPVSVNGQPAMLTQITPTPEPTFDPRTLYPLTLAEAEEQAGFALLSPAHLPETYTFIGAAYDEQTQVAESSYIYHHPVYPDAQGGLVVRQQLAPAGVDCDLCGFTRRDGKLPFDAPLNQILKMVPQEAIIEMVQVGELTAQYVEGTEYNGGQWDPTPFRKRLRFQLNGVAIELWSDSFELSKADLITIAEDLQ